MVYTAVPHVAASYRGVAASVEHRQAFVRLSRPAPEGYPTVNLFSIAVYVYVERLRVRRCVDRVTCLPQILRSLTNTMALNTAHCTLYRAVCRRLSIYIYRIHRSFLIIPIGQ